jgi:hypothetical protein
MLLWWYQGRMEISCYFAYRYYGVVALLPIFQYANVYAATPKLRMLAENKVLQQRCIKYVSKSGMVSLTKIHVGEL